MIGGRYEHMSIASRPYITMTISFDEETRIDYLLGPEGAEFSFPGGLLELIFDQGSLEQLVASSQAALAAMRRKAAV